VREIRTLRAMWRGLETETWLGLRHRHLAKAAGNGYSLTHSTAPALDPTTQNPPLSPGLYQCSPSAGRHLHRACSVIKSRISFVFLVSPRMSHRKQIHLLRVQEHLYH
jgi:hypothetical protein